MGWVFDSIGFQETIKRLPCGFATGDVTLSGTAGATTATVTGSGTTYNVAVSGMTANGTVIASLLAGVAHDAANNPSLASTSTDNTVTFSSLLPIADIGDTYTVSEGSSVTLDASNSDDPDGWIVSYLWDLDNDGQYDDASGVTANFSRTDDGSYTVGVKVIDNFGGEDTDTATVTVTNVAPPLPDYNGNGGVDAADYVVWRKTLGSTTNLLANGDDTGPSAGIIDQANYAVWRTNFGNTAAAAGSGSAQSAVNANALPVVTTATMAPLSSAAVDAAMAESVAAAVPLTSTYSTSGFPTVKRALARPGRRFDHSLPDNNALLALASGRPFDR